MRLLASLGVTNDHGSLFVIPSAARDLVGNAIIKRLRFLALLGMTNDHGSLFVIPNGVRNLF